MLRHIVFVTALLVAGAPAATEAAPAPSSLSRSGQVVRWSGQLDRPGVPRCGEPRAIGCDVTPLTVVAPRGAWITVAVDNREGYVHVSERGVTVGNNGLSITPGTQSSHVSTTFQQVRGGRVTYDVGVSDLGASPARPVSYRATARLAGTAFDREGDCFGDSGLEAATSTEDNRLLPLSVRLLAPAKDVAEVRQVVVPALVETFRRIGVVVRASVDVVRGSTYEHFPFEAAQRQYGGVRPPGVDVVFLFDDEFGGGAAACIGGVAYPEKAFASGQLHYAVEGAVPVPTVRAAVIVAHEIGHLLGGQHQMANCAEAAPQQVLQPASDGSIGPCTVMGPAAVQDSETWSTLERLSIRSFVRQFARG